MPAARRATRLLLALALAAAACAAPAAGARDLKPWTGGAAPALALQDLGGRTVRLEDFRGRVVVVNFWATWCEPCRDEMPSLQNLKGRLAGKPFELLAVNMAEPRSRVEAFVARLHLDLAVLLDPTGDTTRRWQARVLPATFIVGPDGRIRYSHVGELDWAQPRVVETITALLRTRP